jgi:hypothetical protein
MKRFVTLLILAILLLAFYTWATLTWSYSFGERAGYVQKISKKGWVCKTWEGELAMINMPGTLTEKFNFTVHDDNIIKKINQSMGKRVTLVYEEHVGVPFTCFGDTGHYITDVVIAD